MHNGYLEAYHLEASRSSLFPFLPRVMRFSFYDRAVLVITAYGLRETRGGTACGQPMKSCANRGTAPGQSGMHGARNLHDRLMKNHLVFTPEAGIQGKQV